MKTTQNKNKCLTTLFRYIEESMACVNILFQGGYKKKRLNNTNMLFGKGFLHKRKWLANHC